MEAIDGGLEELFARFHRACGERGQAKGHWNGNHLCFESRNRAETNSRLFDPQNGFLTVRGWYRPPARRLKKIFLSSAGPTCIPLRSRRFAAGRIPGDREQAAAPIVAEGNHTVSQPKKTWWFKGASLP